MGWAHSSQPSEGQAARTDLARELDVALHGHATFDGPVTETRWGRLLQEVRDMARPVSSAIAEARQARSDGAAMRADRWVSSAIAEARQARSDGAAMRADR